jgi:cation diffusion facilitator CzcD-associated flavoprotein CzcO
MSADTSILQALVVGAGFGGIGMAIALRRAGVTDFLVVERAKDVGGVWRDNTYPGAACDIPSHLYSFSFEPNPAWTHTFANTMSNPTCGWGSRSKALISTTNRACGGCSWPAGANC